MRNRAALPKRGQGGHQMIDIGIRMERRGRNAQPFGALGDRRIVDGLHIDAPVIHQDIADHPALDRVADHHRDDVAVIGHMGNARAVKLRAQLGHLRLLTRATRDLPCEAFPTEDGAPDKPGVILELDYWALMVR